MADIAQLERALVKADVAGDAEAAKAFAAEIRRMRTTQPSEASRYLDAARAERQSAAFQEGIKAGDSFQMFAPNLAAGAIRGAGSIGATLLAPKDMISDALAGKGVSLEANRQRRQGMDFSLEEFGADSNSLGYGLGKVATEVAGTAGAGGMLANGARRLAPALVASSPTAAKAVNALASAGFRTGAPASATLAGKAGDMAIRSVAGGINGAFSSALVNPEYAGTGGAVGALMPGALAAAGAAGKYVGNKLAGPTVAPELRQAAESARAAGYVIPPTQVRPTLTNRALEGFAGKITTAQNASARNQPVTNELARKAIGATDLSEAGIAQVRAQANQAYDALGQMGKFQADAGFAQALDNAGAVSAAMRANFPELVNSKVDDLISGLKSRPEFEAQPTIEAIKQFRADAATNKAALDPAQKAMGKAQAKIAGALEDLIERNLQATGNKPLLDSYRAARQTLAKTYDVEKALNRATGDVDARKLAQIMQKGRPMTDDLRTIAEFAARFPKANQTVAQMGSLPGLSPLDFGALGTASAITSNPMLMAGVVARPMARSAALSAPVQNSLARAPTPGVVNRLLGNEAVNQLGYRSAPVVVSGRR